MKIMFLLSKRFGFSFMFFKCMDFKFLFPIITIFFCCASQINSFLPNAVFLYPLKTYENLKVFWCFRGVETRCNGEKNGLTLTLQATLTLQDEMKSGNIFQFVHVLQLLFDKTLESRKFPENLSRCLTNFQKNILYIKEVTDLLPLCS